MPNITTNHAITYSNLTENSVERIGQKIISQIRLISVTMWLYISSADSILGVLVFIISKTKTALRSWGLVFEGLSFVTPTVYAVTIHVVLFISGRSRVTKEGILVASEPDACTIVCTIWRETKCWRAETFVFAIDLKGHWGRLHSSDGSRNTTRRRRSGLLESCGCRLPRQSGLTRRRAYIL